MKVPPALIKRLKHHFQPVPEYSAELVLGCNGFVWVQERRAAADAAEAADDGGAAAMQQDDAGWGKENDKAPVGASQGGHQRASRDSPSRSPGSPNLSLVPCARADAETREKLCRLANAVRVLASLFLTIAPAVRCARLHSTPLPKGEASAVPEHTPLLPRTSNYARVALTGDRRRR